MVFPYFDLNIYYLRLLFLIDYTFPEITEIPNTNYDFYHSLMEQSADFTYYIEHCFLPKIIFAKKKSLMHSVICNYPVSASENSCTKQGLSSIIQV